MSGIRRIQIEQQFASIGITTQNAQMRITSPRPQMRYKNDIPKAEISTTLPQFKVDWSRIRGEAGLKSPADLATSLRDQARMKTAQAVDTFVSDGNYLSQVEQKGDRVAQLSRQETLKDAGITINLGMMPQNGPEFTWEPGSIDIQWSEGGLVVEWSNTQTRPRLELDPPYSVEIFLHNKPHIRITVVEDSAAGLAGNTIDRNA